MANTVDLNNITEYEEDENTLEEKIDQLATLIQEAEKVVFFTGAGISTAAKISDYRGPTGVWTRKAQGLPPEKSVAFTEAIPTLTHMALKTLILDLPQAQHIISQNVDGLHRRSGISRENISELHGNTFKEVCWNCNADFIRRQEVRGRIKAPKTCRECLQKVPHYCHCTGRQCPKCGSNLKDSIIHFQENLPESELLAGFEHSGDATVHIVLGSSLRVRPACEMPLETKKNGGSLVIINLQHTPYDEQCAVRIYAKTDQVMEALMQKLGMNIHEYVDLLEEDATDAMEIERNANNEEDLLNSEAPMVSEYTPPGGFHVEPVGSCPHIRSDLTVNLPENLADLIDAPCTLCGDEGENIICGKCYTVACGRARNQHMIQHHEQTKHNIVIGINDLSFWCYACDNYLSTKIPEVAYVYNELHKIKFNEPAPGIHVPEESILEAQIQERFPARIAGLWEGLNVPHVSCGQSNWNLKWTLSIIPTDHAPNMFGTVISENEVTFLKGVFDKTIKKFVLKHQVDGSSQVITYEGELCIQNMSWVLRGEFKNEDSSLFGTFGAVLN